MADLKIDAQPRDVTSRKARQLRRDGLVPVVVYGPATESTNLQVSSRDLNTALRHGARSQLVTVDVEGGGMLNVLVREIQQDPVSHAYVHADFYAVDMTQEQEVSVNVHSVGDPEALVTGLMIYQALDSVIIRALPSAIPASVEVNIEDLTLEHSINISDLPEIEGVTYIGELDETVFTMITTRVEEEEEEEEILEEGMEPEVVGRGGDDEEEFDDDDE